MSNICQRYIKRHCEERNGGSYMKLLNTLSTDLEEMLTELCDDKNLASQQGEGERAASAVPTSESGPQAAAQPEQRPDARLLALREEVQQSPLSPSTEPVELDTSAFRRRLADRLQQAEQRARERDEPLPAEEALFKYIPSGREYREPLTGEPGTRERSGERVAFSEEVRVRGPASVHSRLSDTEARIREAERQAAERMAAIEKRKLELEQEAIQRQLAATKDRIIEEGTRTGGSIADPSQRVDRWLDSVPANPETPLRRRDVPQDERPHSPHSSRHRTRSPDPTRPTHTSSPRDRSSSKSRGIERLAEHLETMMRPPPRQVYELPTYGGEPHEWQTFLHAYNQSTIRYKFKNYENVARLRHCLRGEARQCVQHLLASTSSPDLIVRVLKKNFGRTDLLIDRAIDELRRLPAVGPSATDLNTFAIRIINIVATLVDLDTRSYSANPLIIREITDRLSPHLRSRWCAYAKANLTPGRSELLLIAEFLMEESDMELEFSHARAPSRKGNERSLPARPSREPRRAEPRTYGANGGAAGTGAGGAYRRPPARTQTYATDRVDTCLCCGSGHRTTNCEKLSKMSVNERWKWARDNRICYKCLAGKHRKESCKVRGCSVPECPHAHHPMLHDTGSGVVATSSPRSPPRVPARPSTPPRREQDDRSPEEQPPMESRVFTGNATSENRRSTTTVLLKMLPVIVSGPKGQAITYALLDEGSTISLIDSEFAEEVGASGPRSALCIQGVGTMETTQQSAHVSVEVRGCDGGSTHGLSLRTVQGLNLRRQRVPRQRVETYKHLRDLPNIFYTDAEPKILIGADHWHLTLPKEVRVGRADEPAAVRTELGWAIFGSIPRASADVQVNHIRAIDELHELVDTHFKIDALGIKAAEHVRREDQRALEIFKETVSRIDGPRYEVGQLWRKDETRLPASYSAAFTRLRGIERKCDREPEFATQYSAQIQNLLEKGYAERVIEQTPSDVKWYLPHFAVTNPQKPGKIRLVFDAAAKCEGQSLNDHVLEGPDLLQSLLGILIRFREGAIAVTADIKEMFLQVKIRGSDQASQMFLWRGADRTSPPAQYKMTSMIFGAASSPFLAHSVRNHNAKVNEDKFPKAVSEISNNHYMDDFVSSFQDEKEAIEIAEQVAASHAEAGFELRAWATNSARLLERVPAELRAIEPTQLGQAKEQKILGMIYCYHSDNLGFNTSLLRVPAEVKAQQRAPTKREVLSATMSIYDPLGLLSHYTITAKVQLQRLWAADLSWDVALPADEARRFYEWLRALDIVAELRVPRQYFTNKQQTVSLHVFTDASAQAYAAAAYVRQESPNDVQMSLIAAKSRVAPKRQLSIPRLELQAALIGSRLAHSIQRASRLPLDDVVLWTDSKTVIQWIRNGARRYSAFVSHRLSEITEATGVEQWRWVPTGLNPADEATRDDIKEVRYDSRWYQGPEFLRGPEPEWPEEPSGLRNEPLLETMEARAACTTKEYHSPLPDITRFSNYERLINSTARVLLFVEQLKNKTRVPLGVQHILAAEKLWFQYTQRRDFPEELRSLQRGEPVDRRSKLYELDPVLADDGVVRLRGRIDAAPVALNKRPAILDGRSAFVRLLIERAHRRALHANNERVINDLKQEFWILRLRTAVRGVAHRCRLCALRRAQPQVPPMGDLPLARIEPYTKPFENCGLDYFGPITVSIGRRHEKRWVALFTCMSTRAVHLETVHTLSTDSAIMALRRMASRRGWPRTMWSDNATCFRAADNELRAAYAEWLPALRDYGLLHKLSWRFIPPIAPNQGGAWERMVRSIKTALAVTLKSRAPKEEVLATLLAEAEYSVNSRPLTHVSVDPSDPEALTPNHFLLGGPRTVPPTGPCEEADRRTWRAAQALADHFWRRWVQEYLPSLAPRRSSPAGERPLQLNDYVLIVDPNLPRNVWPRGVVVRTYTGPDGGVRSADVRTRGVVLRRPTTKLAVLPVQPAVADEATAGGEMLGTAPAEPAARPGSLDT